MKPAVFTVVVDEVTIDRPRQKVIECVWNLALLPSIVPHVERVDVFETGPSAQRFAMILRSGAQTFQTESSRSRVGVESIHYHQSRPPRVLSHHEGGWSFFDEGPSRTRIKLEHRFVIAEEEAARILAVPEEKIPSEVARRIQENGRATLTAYKCYLEENRAES